MSMPAFHTNKAVRRVLKVLTDDDDGELYGLRIAQLTRQRWRLPLSSGHVSVILMRLERHGWITSRWEELDSEVEAAFPGRWTPRKRFYSLHPDHLDDAKHLTR